MKALAVSADWFPLEVGNRWSYRCVYRIPPGYVCGVEGEGCSARPLLKGRWSMPRIVESVEIMRPPDAVSACTTDPARWPKWQSAMPEAGQRTASWAQKCQFPARRSQSGRASLPTVGFHASDR
jgi:hypothetical protein